MGGYFSYGTDWLLWDEGGGGDSSPSSGDGQTQDGSGDGVEEVTFDDSEAEVFQATEIIFDDSDAEVFDGAELLNELQKAKQSMANSAVEAGKESNFYWGIAVGASKIPVLGEAVSAPAGLAASAFGYMSNMAQGMANDPPRDDTGVVTRFRKFPLHRPLKQLPTTREAHAYAAGASALPVAVAVGALTASVERFNGAREAVKAGNAAKSRDVILQAAAIKASADAAAWNIARLVNAMENYRRRAGSLFTDAAGAIQNLAAKDLADGIRGAWEMARLGFNLQRTPETFKAIDAGVQKIIGDVQSGSVTPASLVALLGQGGPSTEAIANTAGSLQSLSDVFAKAGKASNVCLLINVTTNTGAPFEGTVNIDCQHQTLSDHQVFQNVDASKTIALQGLMRAPQGMYQVTVTPTAVFKPESQFVNVPASGAITVEFRMNVAASK